MSPRHETIDFMRFISIDNVDGFNACTMKILIACTACHKPRYDHEYLKTDDKMLWKKRGGGGGQ